jgi:hypothetical protein
MCTDLGSVSPCAFIHSNELIPTRCSNYAGRDDSVKIDNSSIERVEEFKYLGTMFIHSFSSLSYDRSKASSKASSLHNAIQSFLFQMRVSSPFLKVIQ